MMKLYARFKFFDAYDYATPRMKTRKLSLQNRSSSDAIGAIKWYPQWRQYCFFPHIGTVWSDGCLADVHKLIQQLEGERERDPKLPSEAAVSNMYEAARNEGTE